MSEYTINGKPAGYSISALARAGENYAEWMLEKQRELDEARARAESAEARLAAVQEMLDDGIKHVVCESDAALVEWARRALSLLTPAQSLGTVDPAEAARPETGDR